MKDYLQFTEEHFILDPEFQKWVKKPDATSDQFWDEFLRKHPYKNEAINNARSILSSFRFTDDLSFAEKNEIWKSINSAIQKGNDGKLVFMKRDRSTSFKQYAPLAAAILLGCVVFAGIKMTGSKKPEQVITTQYGELKRVKLPDSSVITLNAHSHVSYNPQWNNAKREIWIEGEAYFSVKHTTTNQLFIVHTSMFDIEVLGTEFNVLQRDDRIKVSLNSGKIRLKAHDENKEDVIMLPGELLEASLTNKQFQKKSVKAESISAWKERKLLFDDTPLSEIIETLKYTYGWEAAKVDDGLLNEKISGEIGTKDETEFINTLAKALGISIKKEGSKLYITRL